MKRILVTGANKGIGLAIARAILEEKPDTCVFLGSRDGQRGQRAIDQLVAEHPAFRERLSLVEIDVTDEESVRKAADHVSEILGEGERLYGLVNNAGVGFGAGSLADVLEVNTLGVCRVCEAFVPLLEPRGRVVNITSAAGPNFVTTCSPERQRVLTDPEVEWSALQAIIVESLALEGNAEGFASAGLGKGEPYGLSKALANAYTLILAREHPELRINACTPGFIETDLTRPYAESQGVAPADMGMKPPSEGTKSALFLLFGEPEGNGRYYGSDAQRSPLDRYRAPGTPPYLGT